MKLAIINCSIRQDNTTQTTVQVYQRQAAGMGIDNSVVTIEPFGDLFDGTYISADTAKPGQKQVLDSMMAADVLLFVVPTYYKSLPGAAKNFFDIVKCPEAYANKNIGFVASNHKNQDYGARHALQIVQGLLIFFDITAVIVPEIGITDPAKPNDIEAERILQVLQTYYRRYKFA